MRRCDVRHRGLRRIVPLLLLRWRRAGQSAGQFEKRGDAMQFINPTARVLICYVVCLLAGQALAVGIGLLLDPYSKPAALATFILAYYAMYWVAWRLALLIADRTAEPVPARSGSASPPKIMAWLLAPAVLVLDFD